MRRKSHPSDKADSQVVRGSLALGATYMWLSLVSNPLSLNVFHSLVLSAPTLDRVTTSGSHKECQVIGTREKTGCLSLGFILTEKIRS